MAATYDERAVPGRGRAKHSVHNSSGSVTRHEPIPPPHLHSSQLYLQANGGGTFMRESLPGTDSEDHFGHFVSEHEIKFTRNEVCSPSTCICFFIAFLFSSMAIMSGIYYGLNFFDGKQVKERMFKVQLVVFDLPTANLDNAESNEFKSLSWSMKRQIDTLFKESVLARSYVKSEIVAFERKPNKAAEVVVHFNIHVASTKRNVEVSDIYLVLADEIANNRMKVFEKWNIEHNSLDVQERRWAPREKSALLVNPWTYKSIFPGMLEGLSTEPTPAPRKCMPLGLNYCRFLPYNRTSYPNALNHWNLSSVEEDFIAYKEIIDSECYPLAREFLCALLQPECVEDEIVLPCKSFCNEFFDACQRWLPEKVASKIMCTTFPDSVPRANRNKRQPFCRGKPNCAASLRLQFQDRRQCDGIFDCHDKSDEQGCSYCDEKAFHCGNKQCVPSNSTCNSVKECHSGIDESECLMLVSSTEQIGKEETTATAAGHKHGESLPSGYLVANYKGRNSLMCSEGGLTQLANYSHMYYNNQLQILGLNICNEMHFEELIHIESKHVASNGPFSRFVQGSLISPYWSQCKNRQIYYVECAIAKCGISVPVVSASNGIGQAFPGNWPWYAKITDKSGNYYCDGTLISADAVIAQANCFASESQMPSSHNLSVTLATVRFQQDNVEAKQFAVSQISSLSEMGGDVHLLRLSTASNASQNIRPVCQTRADVVQGSLSNISSLQQCVLLSLNFAADRLLSRAVQVLPTLEKCHEQQTNNSGINFQQSHWSAASDHQERRKVCVQFTEADWSLAGAGGQSCAKFGSAECLPSPYGNGAGRHLFCQIKSIWHLFAIEAAVSQRRPSTAETGDKRLNFHLFETLPRLTL